VRNCADTLANDADNRLATRGCTDYLSLGPFPREAQAVSDTFAGSQALSSSAVDWHLLHAALALLWRGQDSKVG
jgi:hypothetical protein